MLRTIYEGSQKRKTTLTYREREVSNCIPILYENSMDIFNLFAEPLIDSQSYIFNGFW